MPTYTKISYDTETYTDIGDSPGHGYGILADNEDILANSEDYYADGSVVMNDNLAFEPEILCKNTVILCSDKWSLLANGCEFYIPVVSTDNKISTENNYFLLLENSSFLLLE